MQTKKLNRMSNTSFVLERVFHAPVSKVWQAITDREEMKEWYFDLSEFKPEVGFEFQFWGQNEDRKYLHLCKIIEVIAGKKISYSWRYEGFEGSSVVTFELRPEGNKTSLMLTHIGLDTFPANNPDFAYENFVKGWTNIIGTGLMKFIEN